MEAAPELILVGHVSGIFGVQGWVRVFSFTSPRHNILSYSPWLVGKPPDLRERRVVEGRRHGNGIIAHLEGCEDRDTAALLIGADISIHRSQLPSAKKGEYYWTDLIGLDVVTLEGMRLGAVDHLLETGANDVLVVKDGRKRLIPYLPGKVIMEVDLKSKLIRVDWDPEF